MSTLVCCPDRPAAEDVANPTREIGPTGLHICDTHTDACNAPLSGDVSPLAVGDFRKFV